MSKKKNSKALFEVIANSKRQGDANMSVPTWMEGQEQEEPCGPKSSEESDSPVKPTQVEPQKPKSHSAPTRVERSAKPFEMRIGAGGLTVAVLVVLALVVMAFWMGTKSAATQGEQQSSNPSANNQAAVQNREPVNTGSSENSENTANAGSANANRRTPEKYYLVIQVMNGKTPQDRADALEIAEYCTDCGHPARIAEATDRYFVWSLEPFDAVNAEARQYARQIYQLGKRYRAQYEKDYDFNVLDAEGGVNDRRFLQYRPKR